MEFKKLCVCGKPFGDDRNLDLEKANLKKVDNVDFLDKKFYDILKD
jgi:hypothetical protein